jgi:hypothetical protein
LGQKQKYGGVKQDNGIPPFPSWQLDIQRQGRYTQSKNIHSFVNDFHSTGYGKTIFASEQQEITWSIFLQ